MDEDKEKAEKLAAARRRVEALKKKGKKKGPAKEAAAEDVAGPATSTPVVEEAKKFPDDYVDDDERPETPAEGNPTSSETIASPPPAPDQSSLIEELRSQLSAISDSNADLKAQLSALQDENTTLRKEAIFKDEQLTELKKEKEDIQSQLTSLQSTYDITKSDLISAQSELKVLKETPPPAPETPTPMPAPADESISKELDALRSQHEKTLGELKSARDQISSLQAEVAALKATNDLFAPSPGHSATAPPRHAISPRAIEVHNHSDDAELSQIEESVRQNLKQRVHTLEARLQEEARERESLEIKRRERRKLVEKELEQWRGWKMDLVAAGGGRGVGPVFEL